MSDPVNCIECICCDVPAGEHHKYSAVCSKWGLSYRLLRNSNRFPKQITPPDWCPRRTDAPLP